MSKRVVITGMGVITSLGFDCNTFWESLTEGKSGISAITKFDANDFSTRVAAEITTFDPTEYIERKEAKRMDTYTHYALAAAKEAIESSELDLEKTDRNRMGVIIGSGIGGIETLITQHKILIEKGNKRVSPFFIPMMIANIASGRIAIQFGARGFNESVVTACATSSNAVGDSFKVIQRGDADIMITGGAEASLTPLSFAGFCNMKAMSANEDPDTASRPFDKERDGFVMGEGGGILILEDYTHAAARNAPILGEIVGYGCTCDAYHITAPAEGGEGAARAMKIAISDAGIEPEQIGYINAHGTSTPHNDRNETSAIKTVFDDYAYKIPVSSTKSMTGHLLGAAGAIEAISCLMTMKHSFIPPTINYKTPDPDCDLDYVPNNGRKADIEHCMSNSLGFGGHNTSLVFKRA